MKSDVYQSIAQPAEAHFTDRKSKFIALAFPVTSEEQVRQILKLLHKQYHDARHIAYAFVIGPDAQLYRASDGGEPAGSAGPPILRAIKSMNVSDVLVAVVRYFGGKKLGFSGLINAYGSAAKLALQSANLIEKQIVTSFNLKCDYSFVSKIMSLIERYDGKIIEQKFDQACYLKVLIPKSKAQSFSAHLSQLPVTFQTD